MATIPIKDAVFEGFETGDELQVKVTDNQSNVSFFTYNSIKVGNYHMLVVNFFDYNNPIKDK